MIVESTVLRKSAAGSPAAVIDSALVSSFRSDVLRERLKFWYISWVFSMGF